ncbi:UxaA family hydrolase [bacterium]|nr:UxaA family hydrolase [bacterium]
MSDDIDIIAGVVLEGSSLETVGADVLDLVKRSANGEQTMAEINRQNGILCIYTQTTSF